MYGCSILSRRKGAVLVEALLAFPVLVLITFAGAQYSQVVLVEQAVQAAADAAAREAAKASVVSPQHRVETVVNQHLAAFGLVVGAGVRVDVNGEHTESSDARYVPAPPIPVLLGRDVCVTVQVQYAATRLPNALGYFGIDFSGRVFRATSVARVQ